MNKPRPRLNQEILRTEINLKELRRIICDKLVLAFCLSLQEPSYSDLLPFLQLLTVIYNNRLCLQLWRLVKLTNVTTAY
jgi:hypothetical protein